MFKKSKMQKLKDTLTSMCRQSGHLFVGLLVCLSIPIYLILSFPTFLYYWLVIKILVPIYRPDIVKRADNVEALEFLQSKQHIHPRSSIVISLVLEGTVGRQDLLYLVQKNWIEKKLEGTDDKLKYPELQRCIERWMGFIFWKQEDKFNLENHLYYFHEIEEGASHEDSKVFVDELVESLLNKPYRPLRSPWEMHVVYNYKELDLIQRSEMDQMTVILFRCHCAMVEDPSWIFDLFSGSLFDNDKPSSEANNDTKSEKMNTKHSLKTYLRKLRAYIKLPFRFIREIGYITIPVFLRKDPWYIPDRRKNWIQLYARSNLISLDKIRDIQASIGGTFLGVVLSSVSVGIAEAFKAKGHRCPRLHMGISSQLEEGQLEIMESLMDFPVKQDLPPLSRLEDMERSLLYSKSSCIPYIASASKKMVQYQVAPLAHFVYSIGKLSTTCVAFSSPLGKELSLRGRKLLTSHFALGCLLGSVGVGFQILEYNDHLHISATAESSVMNRPELEQILDETTKHIDRLQEEIRFKMKMMDNPLASEIELV